MYCLLLALAVSQILFDVPQFSVVRCCLFARLREMMGRFRTECRFLKPSSAIWNNSTVKMTSKVSFVLRRVCVLLIFVALAAHGLAGSFDDEFRQGDKLQEQLVHRRSISVESVLLRDLLRDIQAQSGICVILDRCVDPSTRMSLTTPLVRTDKLLRLVSEELPDAGVSISRELVYFGPRNRSELLRTLVEQNRAAVRDSSREYSRETYSALTARTKLRWPDLTTPRDVVTRLATDVGLELTNPQAIPHDLWESGRLPRLSFVEAATLLLIQFDLTVEIQPEANTCAIVEIPGDVVIKKQHLIPRQMRESARSLIEARMPGLAARWTRTKVEFRGTIEEHEQVTALFKSQSEDQTAMRTESLKTRVLTLLIPNGLTYRQVIAQLQQSGVKIRDEAALGAELDAEVSVQLKNLVGEQFFTSLFRKLPVSVEVLDDEVVLRAVNNVN